MATRTQQSYKVTLHWKDGKVQKAIGWGTSRQAAVVDAFNEMGYGVGALAALDYWDAVPEESSPK